MRKAIKILIPVALLSIMIGTIAAVTFFSQQFPQVSVVSTLSANCSNLTDESGSVVNGTAKDLTFDCNPTAAFTVTTQAKYIATFTLPTSISTLAITNGTTYILTSGAQIMLAAGSNYRYIAHYSGALTGPTLGTFSITWSQ